MKHQVKQQRKLEQTKTKPRAAFLDHQTLENICLSGSSLLGHATTVSTVAKRVKADPRETYGTTLSHAATSQKNVWWSRKTRRTSKSDFEVFCTLAECASRRSCVPFFSSPRNSYLRARRFSEPTFRIFGTTNNLRNTAIRDFPNFSRLCIVFVLTSHTCGFFLLTWLLYSSFFNCPYCWKIDFQRSFDYIVLCSTY